MAKIKYVGLKESRADTVAGTGKVWFGKGDVQEVPDIAVPRLLRDPDIWQLEKEEPAAPPPPPPPPPAPAPAGPVASTTPPAPATPSESTSSDAVTNGFTIIHASYSDGWISRLGWELSYFTAKGGAILQLLFLPVCKFIYYIEYLTYRSKTKGNSIQVIGQKSTT